MPDPLQDLRSKDAPFYVCGLAWLLRHIFPCFVVGAGIKEGGFKAGVKGVCIGETEWMGAWGGDARGIEMDLLPWCVFKDKTAPWTLKGGRD